MEEREKNPPAQGGRRGPFIGHPTKIAAAGHFVQSLLPLGGRDSRQGLKAFAPISALSDTLSFGGPETWPEFPVPGAGVSGLEKYPVVLGQNSGRKTAKTHFGPEFPALEKAEIAETKMTIT
jgi:hypothetical protein